MPPPDLVEEYRRALREMSAGADADAPQIAQTATPGVSRSLRLGNQTRADQIVENLPYASSAPVNAALAKIRRMREPDRSIQSEKIKNIMQAQRSALVGASKAASAARSLGDKETHARVSARVDDAIRGRLEWPKQESGAEILSNTLDLIPKHTTRRLLTPGRKPGDEIPSHDEFVRLIRKDAEAGGMISKAVSAAGHVLGIPYDVVVGVPDAAMRAVTNAATGMSAKDNAADIVKNFKEQTMPAAQSFGIALIDPSSIVTLGEGSTIKNAVGPASRALKKAGITGANATALLGEIERIAQTWKASLQQANAVKRAFRNAGLNAEDVYGEGLQFFGRAPAARVHVPFADNIGFDVRPAGDYGVAKKVSQVYDKTLRPAIAAAGKSDPGPLFNQRKKFIEYTQREFRGESADAAAKFLKRFEELSTQGPIRPERRREIVMRYIDPDFKKSGSGYAPTGAAEVLNKHEMKWADDMRALFDDVHQHAVKSGYFDAGQKNYNPVSGRYFPRSFEGKYGIMEDLPGAKVQDSGNIASKARVGVVGVPLGRAQHPFLKGATDPAEAVPDWIQRTTRGSAFKDMERKFVDQFGVPMRDEYKHNLHSFVPVEGTNKALPAHLHNIMQSTAEEGRHWLMKHLRDSEFGRSWQGRAITDVLGAVPQLIGRWKNNLLMTRSGYQVVNVANDTNYMLADGMANPVKWLRRSSQWLRGAGPSVRGMTPQQIVELAAKNGIPIDARAAGAKLEKSTWADSGFDVFGKTIIQNKRVRELDRAAYKTQKGAPHVTPADKTYARTPDIRTAVDAADAFNLPSVKQGERMSAAWESRAKLAHFAWRLSKGDSAAVAAKRTMDTLIDYSHSNIVGRTMKAAGVPFANWITQAPLVTARLAAKKPVSVLAMRRALGAGEEPGNQPPDYVTERGLTRNQGSTSRNAFNAMRRAVGGNELDQEMSLVWNPKDPHGESMALPMETIGKKNPGPLFMQLNPLARFAVENYIAKQDLQTRRPVEPPTVSGMFPADSGMPFGRATDDQLPWASRTALPMILSPQQQTLLNAIANQLGGGDPHAPVRFVGTGRQYVQPAAGKARDTYMSEILNQYTGMPMYEVGPADSLSAATEKNRKTQAAAKAIVDQLVRESRYDQTKKR